MMAGAMPAQDAPPGSAPSTPQSGGPQDWSNRRIIYTRNGSAEEAWKLRDDPRFLQSILLHDMRLRRNLAGPDAAGANGAGANGPGAANEAEWDDSLNEDIPGADTRELEPIAPWEPIVPRPIPLPKNTHSKVDWSVSLGPTAGMAIGESPAVYTANYSSPSCTNDFVVYTINATPSTTVGSGQANLVGLNNLYSNGAGTGSCSGSTGPSFLFSYAIGTGGSALSPVLSLDGTRIAWIENRTATTSYLHITVWGTDQGANATAPVGVTNTLTNGACATTPCDYAIEYTDATPGCNTYIAGNGHSDLYVDYPSDSGFISANNGILYHIKNIFSTTTNPSVDFCVPVNTTFETTPSSAMSGPVYDPLLGEVFITDSEKIYAFNVNATSFSPAATPSYTFGNAASDYDYPTGPGPLLDMFNHYLYIFSTYDKAGKTSVTQVSTGLASAVAVELGPKSTNANPILFYGAFDNNYYNYGPAYGTNPASTLYSCGTDANTTSMQDLFAISFNATSGAANTTPAMSSNTNINPGGESGICSPITEFYDGSNDRIFVGMGEPGATTGANVVTMWNVNTQLTSANDKPTATATGYLGGTSGLSADNNDSGTSQAENVYFSTEEAGNTSTQVSDAAAYNVYGIYTNGSTFPETGGLDDDGNAYSATELGASVTWNGTTFTLGPSNALDTWQATTITLPQNPYSTLTFLGNAVNGNLPSQTFTVTYTDNSTQTFTQSVSDWYTPQYYAGESIAKSTAYRNMYNGQKDDRTFDLYGYSFALNPGKSVKSLTLPGVNAGTTDNVVIVLAIALSSNCGGADYCAVKLTQSGLQ